jgi:hypothetical protein
MSRRRLFQRCVEALQASCRTTTETCPRCDWVAQMQLRTGKLFIITDHLFPTHSYTLAETVAAIHTLDGLLQPPNPQKSLEAIAMLASLRLHPRPGVSSSDAAQERNKARELFDRVYRTIEQHEDVSAQIGNASRSELPPSRAVVDDVEMHIEFAQLLQSENLDRTGNFTRPYVSVKKLGVSTRDC